MVLLRIQTERVARQRRRGWSPEFIFKLTVGPCRFQNPGSDKPLVSEHTLTKEDCRKRLLQFKSPKGGLPFVPGEVYTAEVLIFDNAGQQTLVSRVLQLFCRKDLKTDADE